MLSWESLSARHSIPQLYCQNSTDGTGSRISETLDLGILLGVAGIRNEFKNAVRARILSLGIRSAHVTANYNSTLSPSLVNEARFGVSYNNSLLNPP